MASMDSVNNGCVSAHGSVVRNIVCYRDEPNARVLDMRPEGVSYLHVLSCRTGRIRMQPPALHIHPGVLEICYCLRGSLAFKTPERTYAFLPGCVFTSRDNEPHNMTANPKGLFVYRVLAAMPSKGRNFDGLSAADSAWLRRQLLELPRLFTVQGSALRKAFERMFAAYDDRFADADRRRIELRRRALDILLECVDAAAQGTSRRRLPHVEEWVRRMEERPDADYPLGDMCRSCGLRPATFVQSFKEIAGLPPQAYLRSCRIMAAARLLDAGQSVTSVALKLRFCSAQYFATVFKEVTGVSPHAWRKRSE